MPARLQVTKLQAAERQLAVATELYFRDSDPVAIHSLVAASYNIIHDLSKHTNAPPMAVKDYFPTTVSPEKQREVAAWVNSFENFFKHADRDPAAAIEVNPVLTEAMLQDSWAQYERLGGALPEAGKVFKLWCGNVKESAPEIVERVAAALKSLGKQRFYEVVIEWMRCTILRG